MKLINQEDKICCGLYWNGRSSIIRNLNKKGYKNILSNDKSSLNLLNFNAVEKWFEIQKPDVVIIAAAKVGGIFANSNYPADFLLENIKIQSNLIEISYKKNAKRLLFLGSSCIYPKYANQPILKIN